jgi:hypothetical protein
MGRRHQVSRRRSYGRRQHDVHERDNAPGCHPARRLGLLGVVEASRAAGVKLRPVREILSAQAVNSWVALRGSN